MSDTTSLIEKARQLAKQYESKYFGCAQATFTAIADTLEIYDEKVFKAMIGQTGGTGDTCLGTCGGLSASAAAIGLVFGVNRDDLQQEHVNKISTTVGKVADKFLQEYQSINCQDIQKKLFGRTFNLRDHDELMKFLERPDVWKCSEVCGKAAAWAVKTILETRAK